MTMTKDELLAGIEKKMIDLATIAATKARVEGQEKAFIAELLAAHGKGPHMVNGKPKFIFTSKTGTVYISDPRGTAKGVKRGPRKGKSVPPVAAAEVTAPVEAQDLGEAPEETEETEEEAPESGGFTAEQLADKPEDAFEGSEEDEDPLAGLDLG